MNKERVIVIQKVLKGSGLNIYVFDGENQEVTTKVFDLKPVLERDFGAILDHAKFVAKARAEGKMGAHARSGVKIGDKHISYQIC